MCHICLEISVHVFPYLYLILFHNTKINSVVGTQFIERKKLIHKFTFYEKQNIVSTKITEYQPYIHLKCMSSVYTYIIIYNTFAGFCVGAEVVSFWTGAEEAAVCVNALFPAATVVHSTLIYVCGISSRTLEYIILYTTSYIVVCKLLWFCNFGYNLNILRSYFLMVRLFANSTELLTLCAL